MGHGRSIINIENKSDQIKVYETIISKNLSVRNTEELVKNYKNNQVTKKGDEVQANKSNHISTWSCLHKPRYTHYGQVFPIW